ncbi:MAG: hypothetical protein P8X42_03345 [Calditrichaceae bacterium]
MKIILMMESQIYRFSLIGLFLSLLVSSFGFSQVRNTQAIGDSLFQNLSIDDLIEIKAYYDSKVRDARDEEENFRQKGMMISEDFLSEKGTQIKDRDRVYIRLAEYYIEEAQRRYNEEVDQYDVNYTKSRNQLRLSFRHLIIPSLLKFMIVF